MNAVRHIPTSLVTWICTACGEEVCADQDGYLSVSMEAVRRYREDLAAFEAAWDEGAATAAGLDHEYPDPVRWRCYHAEHDPDPGGFAYEVELERVRTLATLAGTTRFLAAKNWLQFTDWAEVVERKVP